VGRAADQINKGGHADQAAADAEDAGEPPGEKRDRDGQPGRTIDARDLEVHHRRDLDLVKGFVPFDAGGKFVDFLAGRGGLALLAALDGDIVEDHPGDQRQQDQIHPPDHRADDPDSFQPHDHLGADLETGHRADDHDAAEFVIHVAELAVAHGRYQGFTGHVGDVGADGKGHREAQNVEARGHHPRPAHAEEAADDADTDAQNDEPRPEYFHACDGHEDIQPIHANSPFVRSFADNPLGSESRFNVLPNRGTSGRSRRSA